MTAKKKTLIELMLDAGVKPECLNDRTEFIVCDSASEGTHCISEYHSKPKFKADTQEWYSNGFVSFNLDIKYACKNWKRTIITKQQFVDAYNEKHKPAVNTGKIDLSAGFRERAMNKCVTNIAEDKQVEDIQPCKVAVEGNTGIDFHAALKNMNGTCNDLSFITTNKPTTKSDGSTASYYELPEGAKELQDLISHRDMNSQIGEIFRACYRYGLVEHSDKLRDAKKIKFYADAEIKRLEKLQGSK